MNEFLIFLLLAVTVTGQSVQMAGRMGERDLAAIKECEKDLERQQAWDDKRLIPLKDIEVLHERYGYEMYDSIDSDLNMWYRLDNYSMYFSDFPDHRGPAENFTDCHDLCPSESTLIGGVIATGVSKERDQSLCLVVYPKIQNIRFRKCLTSLADNVPVTSNFQSKFACVPDGFIKRKIIAYCPEGAMSQCREIIVNLPMACSPKLARCKYTHQASLRRIMARKQDRTDAFKARLGSRIRGTGSRGTGNRGTGSRRQDGPRTPQRRTPVRPQPPPLA